jgi:hypothetical protein
VQDVWPDWDIEDAARQGDVPYVLIAPVSQRHRDIWGLGFAPEAPNLLVRRLQITPCRIDEMSSAKILVIGYH